MKKKTRNTSAHLLATDFVNTMADRDVAASLQQIKYETSIFAIEDHYNLRLAVLMQLIFILSAAIFYLILK